MQTHIAYISVGSNVGSRKRNCAAAIDALENTRSTSVLRISPYYETEPVDYADQPWFVNAALEVSTLLDPFQLLKTLQNLQLQAGRVPGSIRFGPRILDLDILLFGDLVIRTPELEIPHPRMASRRFVLKPLCDIDPHILHPTFKKTVGELLRELGDEGPQVVLCP